jgi:hypothetical protein
MTLKIEYRIADAGEKLVSGSNIMFIWYIFLNFGILIFMHLRLWISVSISANL